MCVVVAKFSSCLCSIFKVLRCNVRAMLCCSKVLQWRNLEVARAQFAKGNDDALAPATYNAAQQTQFYTALRCTLQQTTETHH